MEPVADPFQFFAEYVAVTGLPHLGPEKSGDPRLIGRKLGLLHGSSWVAAWGNYFGRIYLPGVQLVDMGNDAIQLNFMRAFAAGQPCPPQANIDCFVRYAIDLVELSQVQAILLTCSTMNRSYPVVEQALRSYGVPVIQIDIPMMERAVTLGSAGSAGGEILVIATHGPTVDSTGKLLQETAARLGRTVASQGALVEEAWHCLMNGDVVGHNRVIAEEITRHKGQGFSCVVLAQLSMSIFRFSYPDPQADFGLPVLSSGQCGFEYVRDIMMELPAAK